MKFPNPYLIFALTLGAFMFCRLIIARAASPDIVTIGEIRSSCESGPGPLSNTTCKTLRVSVPDLPDIDVELRITEPPAGVAVRGTVVFGTGGSGAFFSYDQKPPLMADLQKAGFRLVQRRWSSPWAKDRGLLLGARRYATLLSWIHRRLAGSGAFCATGNSNGAAELGYALARYRGDEILDLAIPSSGPWAARLDLSCLGWDQECRALTTAQGYDCTKQGCQVGNIDASYPNAETPCAKARRGDPQGLRFLQNESILSPDARRSYPRTRLHFFYGSADCGQTVPTGLKFASMVTSEKAITVVPGAPHQVYDSPEGNIAIRDEILSGCVKRH